MRLALGAARAVITAAIFVLFAIGALPIMAAQRLIGTQKYLTRKIEARRRAQFGGFWNE